MNEIYDEEIKELEDEILLDMQEDDAEEYEDAPKHKYKKSTIIAIGQDKPLAAKERHYVSKEDFFNAIVKRKALLKTYQEKLEQGLDVKKPQISNEIGEYIVKICTNLSKKSNFAKKRYDGFRADMIIDKKVLLELKSIEALAPVHFKQVLTYLKLTDIKLGLLINFNVNLIKDGIHRIVNKL